MSRARLLRGWPVLAAWLAAFSASAQTLSPPPPLSELQLERVFINPSLGPGLLVANAESLRKGVLVVGGTFGYEKNPVLLFRGTLATGALIADKMVMQGHLAYGVNDGLMVAAEGIIFSHQRGESLGTDEVPVPRRWNTGALRLSARAQLLSQKETGLVAWKMPIDLALGLLWSPPFGTTGGFAREDGFYMEPQLSMGHSFATFRMGGEAAVAVRGPTGNELLFKLLLATTEDRLRYELAVLATVPVGAEKDTVGIELIAALRTQVGPVELFVAGGPGFGRLVGTPQLRVLGGAAWRSATSAP